MIDLNSKKSHIHLILDQEMFLVDNLHIKKFYSFTRDKNQFIDVIVYDNINNKVLFMTLKTENSKKIPSLKTEINLD